MSKSKRNTTSRRKSRPTIGYLTPSIQEDTGQSQLLGAVDAARKRDVSLISFVGGYWADPRGFQAQANVLYDLASAENVDGVVSWASLIGLYTTADETRAFHERYRSLPSVAIGGEYEGVPGLFVDTYEGMHAAVVHLIEAHGYRRLVFISGPEGNLYAEERYRAYTDALEAYGLRLDPNLVAPPVPWEVSSGMKSMSLLLDERRLRPQVDFDAVVAASDLLLLGALEALQAREIRVPGDVGAVGFDDIMEGRVSTPPFTTGIRPWYPVGYQAVETLLDLIEGAQIPAKTIVPSGLVIRQSCGCSSSASQARVGPVEASGETLESVLTSRRAEVLLAMAQAIGESGKVATGEVGHLLDGFVGELKGGVPGLLVRELDEALRRATATGGDVVAWQGAISVLRQQMLPHLQGQALALAEDLWQQARVVVAETALRVQAQAQLQAAQQTQVLREIGAALITTFDVEGLMAVLIEGLPRLGIPSCYISLYENPQEPTEWSRLILAYDEDGRVDLEPGGRRFRSRELAPEKTWPQGRQFSYVVEPLYFQNNQLGFALFEVGPREGTVYETLRGEISSALYGALLVQQTRDYVVRVQTAAEVSRAASSILDPDELIHQVVNLVQERLDLYYAGLFLIDRPGEWAVLRAGTGEAGQQMLAQGHRLEIDGESMVGRCIATKQARIALDVGGEAVRFDNPFLPETRSELALPLIGRGEAIGALTIQSAQEAAFGTEDIAVLQTMADQLANAIVNARLFDRAQAQAGEMSVLSELARTLSSRLTVQEVLNETHQGASRLLDATNFFIALYDPNAHQVSFPYDTTREEGDRFLTLPADQGITGYIIHHRESVLIRENVLERLAEMGMELVGEPALSWLGVPMMVGDQVLGVMGVQSFTTPRAYDEHDRELLTALAAQVASALTNARLFEQTQTALAEVEATQRRYLERGWSEYAQTRRVSGYEQAGVDLVPLDDALLPEVRQAMREQRTIVLEGDDEASVLVVPIMLRGQSLGAVGFKLAGKGRDWGTDDISLVEGISEQFALAAENIRLLDETQRRAARERLTRDITDKLRRAASIDDVVQTAVDELFGALRTSRAFVRLGVTASPQDDGGGKEES